MFVQNEDHKYVKILFYFLYTKKQQPCRWKEMRTLRRQRQKPDSIYCLVQGKDTVAEYIRNGQLAEMEVFVFFICKMTLLVRIVGGSKLTPYDSNCSKSVCVCVFVRARVLVCVECSGVCVSGHQTELQGLQRGTAGRWMRSELQRANVKEEILPSALLPLHQDRPLHGVFQTLACR